MVRGRRMSDRQVDVVVIGGGPGGATAATLLARRGRKVLVLEKEAFPRFRIGESLLPMSLEIYERLGLAEEMDRRFIRKYGGHFIHSPNGETAAGGRLENIFEFKDALGCPYPYAYHVPRDEHDRMLLDNARRAGVEVREGCRVDDVLFERDRAIGVRAGNETIRSTFVIDASGRACLIARKLRLRKPDPHLGKASVFSHYRGAARLPGLHEGSPTVATFEGGWLWMIPFKGDVTSVGAVMHRSYWREWESSPETLLDRAIESCPPVKERLEGAERILPVMAEGSFSYRSRRFSGPGYVLCGDAAAFLDPVFSSGVYLSMRGAEEIAALIDRGLSAGDSSARLFAGYERRMRAAMKLFWRFIHGFYDESFLRIFLQPTRRFQLLETISGVLAGNIFPSAKSRLRLWMFGVIVLIARGVYRLRGLHVPNRLRD
jgi:flavin-dependent dehydrogenase